MARSSDDSRESTIAVEKALAQDFDLILMDMQMPIMDGYTAAATLRRQQYAGSIIALTANAMQDDEERCRVSGCHGYLTMPINMDRLLDVLGEELGFVDSASLSGPIPRRRNRRPKYRAVSLMAEYATMK